LEKLGVVAAVRKKRADPYLREEARPLVQIRPQGRFSALNLGELWKYRDLFWALALRDVMLRYKQTALGMLWVIFQPLAGAGIFTFVFGIIAGLPSDGVPYFVLTFSGMMAWQAFNSTLTKSSACIVMNSQLVSKVYFPRLILPLSSVLSTLIDFLVSLPFIAALMLWYGIVPGPGLLLMPVILVLLIMLAVGLGLFTSALMVNYRDLQYVIPVLLQFLLYISPVGYSIPRRFAAVALLNPLAPLLEAFRWSLLGQGVVHWNYFGYSVAAAAVIFVWGAIVFKWMEKGFADII
jgi:lipopolysaccharide transport system permease protein